MSERVILSTEHTEFITKAVRLGWRVKCDKWTVVRVALARSLQEPEAADAQKYSPISKSKWGSALHVAQVTGFSKDDFDFHDIYKALLSVYERTDLFLSEDSFLEALQRHIRRGLDLLKDEWRTDSDFLQYLVQQMYYESQGAINSNDAEIDLGLQIQRVLGQLGVGATIIETRSGPRINQYTLELKDLEDLERFRKSLSKLAFALGFDEAGISSQIAPGARRVSLIVPRPSSTWKVVSWGDVRVSLTRPPATVMTLPLCLGTDVLGDALCIDLAEAPHLFIGGTTGSGKSMCLHAILLSLLSSPLQPELVLIDPKAVEFSSYAEAKGLLGNIVTQIDDAISALEGLVEEMEQRQTKIRSFESRNWIEANKHGAELRPIVVVIDELGDLLITRRSVETPLIRLAQKARASGIHLVLATQRPEAATFPGLLRSNIPSRIALTVQKASESRIILDEGGAESLLMRGDMLIKMAGKPLIRAHGCRIEQSDVIAALR